MFDTQKIHECTLSQSATKHFIILKAVYEMSSIAVCFHSPQVTRKTITPCETTQNLLLAAPILNSATVISNGDITMETISAVKVSMAQFPHFLPFMVIFLL